MQKADKEKVVRELASRLASADSLIVADYRGLTNAQLAKLRTELLKHGAKLTVVKNTLTRRAAEEAGTDALLAMLEGPTAIAFVRGRGQPGRRGEGAQRRSQGDEDPRPPGRRAVGQDDHRRRGGEPREAAAARRAAGPARGRHHRSADAARWRC